MHSTSHMCVSCFVAIVFLLFVRTRCCSTSKLLPLLVVSGAAICWHACAVCNLPCGPAVCNAVYAVYVKVLCCQCPRTVGVHDLVSAAAYAACVLQVCLHRRTVCSSSWDAAPSRMVATKSGHSGAKEGHAEYYCFVNTITCLL